MKRPNKLDWMVYRVFRWWWNPILRNNLDVAFRLANSMALWVMGKYDSDVEARPTENEDE